MSEQNVIVERVGSRLDIVLNRPDRKNSITQQLAVELRDAFLNVPSEAGCILLSGSGGAFCSGIDLKIAGADLKNEPLTAWVEVHAAIYKCRVPVVVALERYAINAGAALALAANIVVAGESSFLQVGEIAMGVPAFLGSAGGAVLASKIPTSSMRPMVLVLLIIVAVYTWFKPDLGKFENLRHLPKRRVQIAAIAGVVIGFYDGIFGPGTGSFLMLILVASLGYAFITASAIAKVVNVATNVGAIMVFGINGAVLWQIGIILGVANISGAVIGARLAIKGGSTLVRKVFLLVTVALILKVGIATF